MTHEETIRAALRLASLAWKERPDFHAQIDAAISALAALQEERRLEVVVVEAARRIRHWHDTASGGMVVSWKSVNALWDTLEEYDAAIGEPAASQEPAPIGKPHTAVRCPYMFRDFPGRCSLQAGHEGDHRTIYTPEELSALPEVKNG